MAEDTPGTRVTAAPPDQLVAPQQFSLDVLLEKYAKGGEQSADEVFKRVAHGVAQAEPEALRESVEAGPITYTENVYAIFLISDGT